MTIEYDIDKEGLKIETFPKGVLDLKETIDYFDRLQKDNRVKHGAIEIVYFKRVTDFQFSFSEGENITRSYQKPELIQKIVVTVFVCETDLAYGIGRMLQALHEIANPEHKVLVVRSENDIEKITETRGTLL